MAFARAVTDQIEEMKSTRRGCPQLPKDLPTCLHTVTALEWAQTDPWQFAGLDKFYNYLRGAAALKIPSEWRPFLPRDFDDLS